MTSEDDKRPEPTGGMILQIPLFYWILVAVSVVLNVLVLTMNSASPVLRDPFKLPLLTAAVLAAILLLFVRRRDTDDK